MNISVFHQPRQNYSGWHVKSPTLGPFEVLHLEHGYEIVKGDVIRTVLLYRLRPTDEFVRADLRLWRFIQQAEKVYGREEYLLGLPVLCPKGAF